MTKSGVWKIIAGGLLALGTWGIYTPILPTVPFWILAAIIYLKTDKAMAEKIFANKTYGKIVEDFVVHGIITAKSKKIALSGLGLVGIISAFFTYRIFWLFIVQIAAMAFGAWYVATRREIKVTKMIDINSLPQVRGKIETNVILAPFTWFRVGGPAEVLFQPADEDDLAQFLASLDKSIPVYVIGVGSNLIVRDGGVKGVIIRLTPKGFGQVSVDGNRITSGAMVLDAILAKKAAEAGIAGLEFYRGVPGTIGGALRMNAGCYDKETKDVLVECVAIDRDGKRHVFTNAEMGFSYRKCSLPEDLIFVSAVFEGATDEPEAILKRMDEITARRENSQPIREKTGGSTFKNPDQTQSNGRKSWQVIDSAGLRGFSIGGAQMSEKHCNFMINKGDATAKDLEALGEYVIKTVKEKEGVDLHWEIKRIGDV